MNQPREKNASWVAHTLEIAAAIGVLAAVAIPAFMFPPSDLGSSAAASEDAAEFNFEAAAAPADAKLLGQRFQASRPKSAAKVSAEFAIAAIRRISDRFEFARQMVIARPNVTDADVVELAQLAQMGYVASNVRAEELVLWDWLINVAAIDLSAAGKNVSDVAIEEIAKLKDLEELNLESTNTTDVGLCKLAALEKLSSLNVSATGITDAGLIALDGLRNLEILALDSTAVGDEGISIVRNHPKLQSLAIGKTRVTAAALDYIAELTLLESLDCDNCQIDDQSLRNLANLRRLEYLVLSNTQVTDAGVRKLVHLDGLADLDLSGVNLGDAGRTIIESALPECDILY